MLCHPLILFSEMSLLFCIHLCFHSPLKPTSNATISIGNSRLLCLPPSTRLSAHVCRVCPLAHACRVCTPAHVCPLAHVCRVCPPAHVCPRHTSVTSLLKPSMCSFAQLSLTAEGLHCCDGACLHVGPFSYVTAEPSLQVPALIFLKFLRFHSEKGTGGMGTWGEFQSTYWLLWLCLEQTAFPQGHWETEGQRQFGISQHPPHCAAFS